MGEVGTLLLQANQSFYMLRAHKYLAFSIIKAPSTRSVAFTFEGVSVLATEG